MTTIRFMKYEEAEAVRDLWQQHCIATVGYQLTDSQASQILKNMQGYAEHGTCKCLVALDDNRKIIGFVTFQLTSHPIEPGFAGEIEEHYILPIANRKTIRTNLIRQVVIWLKQQGAGVIKAHVDREDTDELSFWRSLHWEQDVIDFAIYSNLPEDPQAQAVWDSYSS